MILSGELRAGERMNELALATRLGVSRGPVREAARTLERDGLVTSIVNQGVFVRQISIEEAAELYDLRAVIVGYACGRLASGSRPARTGASLARSARPDGRGGAARTRPIATTI